MLNNSDKNKDLSSLLEDLKVELLDYIEKRFRLFKLECFEKGGISASMLIYGFIVLVILGFILFFSLFGLAFFLGELLDSMAAGFGILTLFSILVLLIIIACGKRLRNYILNKTIIFLNKVDKNEAE